MDSTITGAVIGAIAAIIAALLTRDRVVSYRIEGKKREYNLGALLFLVIAFFGGATFLALSAHRFFYWAEVVLVPWFQTNTHQLVWSTPPTTTDLAQAAAALIQSMTPYLGTTVHLIGEMVVLAILAAAAFLGGLGCASYIDP